MAQQNKAQDPLAAAMSAIEDALNLSHEEAPVDTAPGAARQTIAPAGRLVRAKAFSSAGRRGKAGARARAAAQPTPTLKPAVQSGASEAAEAKPILAPAGSPANDDRPSVGQILQAMQTRPPSRAPFIIALVASLVWLTLVRPLFRRSLRRGGFGRSRRARFLAATGNRARRPLGDRSGFIPVRARGSGATGAGIARLGPFDDPGRDAAGRT